MVWSHQLYLLKHKPLPPSLSLAFVVSFNLLSVEVFSPVDFLPYISDFFFANFYWKKGLDLQSFMYLFNVLLPSGIYSLWIHTSYNKFTRNCFIIFCFRTQLEGMHHRWKNKGQCLLIEVLAHQTLQDQQRKPFQWATLSWILKQRLYTHLTSLLNL